MIKPIHCPNCGAPLPASALKKEIAACEFCGTSFRIPTSLTPEPQMGDLLLGADFSQKVMPGWEVLNADRVTFHAGTPPELRGTFPSKVGGSYYMLQSSGVFDDFDVSVSIKFTSGDLKSISAGVYPRIMDEGGYGFMISAQGSYTFGHFERGEKGEWVWKRLLPWSWNTALRAGFNKTNRLRIVCKGDSFRMFLNGVLAGSFKDSRYAVGRVHLTADPGEKESGGFAFSDLQLRETPG